MSAIIYDFKAIGAALRKQRIDDWWQPAKPEPAPEPKADQHTGHYADGRSAMMGAGPIA